MKATIPSVKGARDFYPEDMYVRTWLYNTIRRVSERFGYQEYDGPFLEKLDLYAAKSGEELVKEQSFVFPDRGGELIALRPELTPSLARMIAQRQNELVFPIRWWSFGPFWRYERPQRGRSREFFQWNIDMIGANTPEADAELVAVCATLFREVGLKPSEVVIQVNNRRLMDAELENLGVSSQQRPILFKAVDRRDKMRPEDWDLSLKELGMSADQRAGLKRILADPDLWQNSPEFGRFFDALEAMGVREYVQFDAGIIRGLDYYTGTVFEAKERTLAGRAILGGGRYDNLVSDVGGEQVSSVGFAMGDVMISLVLKDRSLLPEPVGSPAQVLVTVFDDSRLVESLRLTTELRQAGIDAACYPEAIKLPKQLKYADRIGVRWVVLRGPDEAAQDLVTVKDLSNRTQQTYSRDQWVIELKENMGC